MNVTEDSDLEYTIGENESPAEVVFESQNEIAEQPEQEAPQAENTEHRAELDNVSEGVQKRISKLTAQWREAQRREQAALEYAQGLQRQHQEMQQQLVQTDYGRLNEAKTRLETQQQTLKNIIRKAREEGDIDTETEAQQRMTDLILEQRQVAGWMQSQQQQLEKPVARQQQYVQPQPQQQPPQPSPKADAWAARNPWFGSDQTMTYAAWGIHNTLVSDEGFDPNSDQYYTELDKRIKETFPQNFRQQRSVPTVAPATRSSGINTARRVVKLSASQVAIAKKLGVTPEQYAKYVKD
jgi:hypothetical protein